MASDPDRILRSAEPSFQTAFANPAMSHDADGQVETLEQTLESDDKGRPSLSALEPAQPAA